MQRFLLGVALLFSFASALGQPGDSIMVKSQYDGIIRIEGQIDTIPGSVFNLSYYKGDVYIVDTIIINKERKFEYQTISNEPLDVSVNVENHPDKPGYDSTLVGNYPMYSFWAEPNKTTYFRGKKNTVQEVENSATENESVRFKEIIRLIGLGLNKVDRRRAIDSLLGVYLAERPTYYTLYTMGIMLSEDNPDLSLIKNTYNELPLELKQTARAAEINRLIFIKENTSIGKVFPDFQINDQVGEIIQLKEFRGKYVLVDFWASWCAPCRREHPHLVRAHDEYSKKGFEIISISLDDDKKDWLNAVKVDGLTWTQASDLKAFEGELVNRLYIRSIPENYLVDPNGVIIAKGLRGEELLEILKKTIEL